MNKVLLLISAAVVMSACGQSPTAPAAAKMAPGARSSHDDIFCESGYVIAYDENGNPVCVPDPNGGNNFSSTRPTGGNTNNGRGSGSGTPPDSL